MAKHEIEWVNIEVDGVPLRVRKGRYLLWSLRDAYYDVPHFCAHKWLDPPFAGCRMCMVQVETGGKMWPKLQTSCSTLPSEGMKVYLKTQPVIQARKEELEFHLLNHPLECPVCDKGGECMLQDQSMDHGVSAGRYIEEKRIRPDSIINDYMRMNYKRCFHCKRCVHYSEFIDGDNLMKFVKRGAETRIESYPIPGEAPKFSGNLIDICPVGAITARSYRFMGRPWEQELRHSVGSFDSVGSNIWLCARLGELARVIPHDNDEVEFGLIDDVTRFTYEAVNDPRLMTRAILRSSAGEEQVSQGRGEGEAGRRLASIVGEHGPDSAGVLAGSGLNSEEYLAVLKWCSQVLDSGWYSFGEPLFSGGAASPSALASFVNHCTSIDTIVNSSTVLSIGCDLFEEAPALGLRLDINARRGKLQLLSARSHRSDADRFAKHFVDYSHGSLLRVVRGLTNGLSGGECPDELKALVEALKSGGDDCSILYGQEVWRSADSATLIAALGALRAAISQARGGQPVHLNPVFPGVNSAGALLLGELARFRGGAAEGLREAKGSLKELLEAAAAGRLRALVILDYDILSTYPDRALVERALGAAELVIYCGAFETPTSQRANIHLPLGSFAQREGTVVSMEWRVQKREAAVLDIAAVDAAELLNGLTSAMQGAQVADTMAGLYHELCDLLPVYPREAFADFPYGGRLIRPQLAQAGEPAAVSELPAEFKGNAEYPLVVVPKRFLYNDRPEIRCSTAFEKVAMPFFAFMHPQDMKVYNLAAGDLVELQDEKGNSTLPIQPASWVRVGSVVLNDYCISAPVNSLAGFEPVRVRPRKAQKQNQQPAAAAETAAASGGGGE